MEDIWKIERGTQKDIRAKGLKDVENIFPATQVDPRV